MKLHQPGLPEVRSEITRVAQQMFGRNVEISERAFQALEVVTKRGRTPEVTHIWVALSRFLPAVDQLYRHLNIELGKLEKPWPKEPQRLDPLLHQTKGSEWHGLLKVIFAERKGRAQRAYRLTEVGEEVQRSGLIDPEHLAMGILRARRVSTMDGIARTNLVFRYIARAAGYGHSALWDQWLDELSREAVDLFFRLSKIDPSYGEQQFILYHDGSSFRISPFGVFGGYNLEGSPLADGNLLVVRGNVIQPCSRFSQESIEELESLINSGAEEKSFQRFFEKFPEFLLALGNYSRLHPQVVLHEDGGGKLIPDFFLEKLDTDFCDICDLKLPTADLVRYQRHRSRFRDAVMEAVAQLTFYRDWFDDRVHRELFFKKYGLNAYRPQVVIIIGRRQSYYEDIDRIGLENNLPRWVELRTYDDVLARARQWKNFAAPFG